MELDELNRQKLVEELKSIKTTRLTNIVKSISVLIGSIILFIVITRPEYLLNKKVSQEDISRERAKLILNLINENKSSENMLLGLSIIEKAYPIENSQWINSIREILLIRYQKNMNVSQINSIDSNQQKALYQAKLNLNKLLSIKEEFEITKLAQDHLGYKIKIDDSLIATTFFSQYNTLKNKVDADILATKTEIWDLQVNPLINENKYKLYQ
ncbi:hypothetical protein KORDIASMS9_00602 [Kordia sp. SMS9]|uniref:hypothetical protein n=1 Tax=Kordia sp. SMS9 TaxID=2282170 RepID=UPI000E0D498F|nr:hypothetical protein [Kordia sp. SMS9]AXG68387.1 hypothetical protein KORDIASMS9_00602 [Kordia sp. SMS9]